jgi:hypothetical protein
LRKQIKLIVCQPRKKEIGFEKICEMQIRKIGRIGKITVFTDAEFKAQHVFGRKKKVDTQESCMPHHEAETGNRIDRGRASSFAGGTTISITKPDLFLPSFSYAAFARWGEVAVLSRGFST